MDTRLITHTTALSSTHLIAKLRQARQHDPRFYPEAASLFLAGFLIILQPLGVGDNPLYRIVVSSLLIATVHWLVSSVAISASVLKWPILPFSRLREWIRGAAVILAVAIASKLVHWGFGLSTLSDLPLWIYGIFCVLVFPYGYRVHHLRLSLYPTEHPDVALSQQSGNPCFVDAEELPPEVRSLTDDTLYYIESQGNYLLVVRTLNDTVERQMVRVPLKHLVKNIQSPWTVQSHRSYIVNCKKITDINGNSRGYRATVSVGTESIEIPVSPNRVSNLPV